MKTSKLFFFCVMIMSVFLLSGFKCNVEDDEDSTPPSQPQSLSASAVSQSQIDLTWEASIDDVGVFGYKVYRDGSEIATTPGTSYSDTGLSASTEYSYTVSAYDAADNDSYQSDPASAETLSSSEEDSTPPSQPQSLSASAVSQSQIDLTWDASTDDVGVAGYKVYRDGSEITTTPGTSYSDTGLSASTEYSYTVSAYDAADNESNQSDPASAMTLSNGGEDVTSPSQPQNLSAVASSYSQIDLTWDASTDDVGVAGYKVYREGLEIATATGISYSDTGLSYSREYSYTVSAYDAADNESDQSGLASAETLNFIDLNV
ncbi:MAG: hypothetical protein SVR08_14330, partial [Spirochaetota bacterium]|nr:hypothetical protein [Spirochaetota bacterium]